MKDTSPWMWRSCTLGLIATDASSGLGVGARKEKGFRDDIKHVMCVAKIMLEAQRDTNVFRWCYYKVVAPLHLLCIVCLLTRKLDGYKGLNRENYDIWSRLFPGSVKNEQVVALELVARHSQKHGIREMDMLYFLHERKVVFA